MKKTVKKLVLAKETLRTLLDEEFAGIFGRGPLTVEARHCNSDYTCPCPY